jgi:predicted TIM-barrel fold metal-dependent hydrolase
MDSVFDVHVHYPAGSIMGFADRMGRPDAVDERERMQAVDAVVAQSERAGIVKSCLLGGWGRVNGWVLEACRRHPSLFVPMAFVDVDQASAETVEKVRDQGFRGVKLIFPRRNYDDPSYMPLYETMCRLDLVVLFHTGVLGGSEDYLAANPRTPSERGRESDAGFAEVRTSSARMRALYLDTIAMAFPELRIIGAHLGYGEYDLACAVARWRRNVYFDVSGGDVVRRHLKERRYVGREISANKLCFGSDCVTESIAAEVEIWKDQLAEAGLNAEEKARVLYGNAAWLFRVS